MSYKSTNNFSFFICNCIATIYIIDYYTKARYKQINGKINQYLFYSFNL